MIILIQIIILFVFVFTLLMINIPKISDHSYIKAKVYIFLGVFIFTFLIKILSAIHRKCLIDIGKVAKDSLLIALLAALALSIYNDFSWSSNKFIIGLQTKLQQNMAKTLLIMLFIASGYFINALLSGFRASANDCLNLIYQKNN